MSERWRPHSFYSMGPAIAMVMALAYGISGELIFKQTNATDLLMGTLSISFLFLVPFVIGVLTVRFSPLERRSSWPYVVFAPWAVCALLGLVVMLFTLEAWVCVVMGLPLFFVMSSLGGAAMRWWTLRRQDKLDREGKGENYDKYDNTLLGVVLLIPLLFSPVEAYFQPPTTVREVKASVIVNAPAEVIWGEFVTVPKIQPQEEHFAWFRAAGLPHPVEATLVNPGAEGVRYASYDNGMKVIEPVQVWSLNQRYRFGVELDRESGQHTPLWSDVAGEHLHVQWVEYQIEELSDSQVRLHLTSRYALETPINPYAALWVDFLLGDFQQYILDIVTARAEAKA